MASSAPEGLNAQPPTTHLRGTPIDSAPSTPSAIPVEKPNGTFILRIPAMGTPGRDRAESPASTAASGGNGKRKRRAEPTHTIAATRSRRGRVSSPTATGASSRDGSSAPPSSRTTPAPSAGPQGSALSVFAAPVAQDVAAEVQTIVGTSAGPKLREKRSGMSTPEARPTRGGESHVRAGVSASGRGRRVGSRVQKTVPPRQQKGKGKPEIDFVNQDFCSSCRGIGRFLCCDGCPRSFHFMCLEPPLRIDELPEEETWYCNKCKSERSDHVDSPVRGKDKVITTLFKQLVNKVESDNPTQFRLPQEIRQYFVGVTAGPHGEYVDSEAARTKYDRKGFMEERDPTRLRDAKARPITCYKCGGSSIPPRSLASDPEAQWRQIVSCDYCSLNWHLDCLSPPLASMPNAARKWMCPNHADQVMPRRRTVRNGLETVEVENVGTPNNGNVSIVDDPALPPITHEDMLINNRRYRVPERIIQLDFWSKIAAERKRAADVVAGASKEDLDAANLILALTGGQVERPPNSAGSDAPRKIKLRVGRP